MCCIFTTIITQITRNGQVTIPVEIRRVLRLKPKDKIFFELNGDIAKIKPTSSKLVAGFGVVSSKNQPEDFPHIRTEFEKAVADEAAIRSPVKRSASSSCLNITGQSKA